MSVVEKNHLVEIKYKVLDKESGKLLDSSSDEKPFSFLLGENQVISGLENVIIGKKVGSHFEAEILPQDAYGEWNPSFLYEVDKEQFSGLELTQGMTLYGQSEDGQTIQVIVNEIGENSVIVDYNHPLAGKTLLFEVEILNSKEPTPDEILELSHSCACGHSEGGCCGGGGHHHGSGGCGCH